MSKAFKCDNCLEIYEGFPAYKGERIELCPKCLRAIKTFRNSKSFNEQDVNPHTKYSYNSGLCYRDGSPYWGLDVKWCLHEIKHGRIPWQI